MSMKIADKVKNGIPLTSEEFQEIVKKTDWEAYTQRVINRVSEIADRHEKAHYQMNRNMNNRYFSFSNLPLGGML